MIVQWSSFLKTIFVSLFLISSGFYNIVLAQDVNYYYQSKSNRMAAEWEPALGTLIAWPLSIPYKLVIELAADNKLYTLVENEQAKIDAIK